MTMNSNSTTSNTETISNPVDLESAEAPKTDDFGYDDDGDSGEPENKVIKKDDDDLEAVIPDATKPAEAAKPAEATKVEDLTGYGKPAEAAKPAEVVPPVVKTPEQLTEDEKKKGELVAALGELPTNYDKEKITEFALENNFTKEQLSAYAKRIKSDDAANIKAAQEAKDAQRKEWNDSLIADKEFGGENYETSIHNVNRLLTNYMPNTKKLLTEKGGMLPPSLMKDLSTLFKELNPITKLVVGDSNETKVEKHFLDEMYE